MKKVEVVAAVITKDNKILCVQRGIHKYPYLAHKWEFPGGKMEASESQEETIKREIKEELSMEIQPIKHLLSHTHHYPDFSIELHTWLCTPLNDELELKEHQALVWLETKDLKALDWAGADVAVVEILKNQAVLTHRIEHRSS
ncbi:MAG: (deoxy)nucleoside triphosphate pyrophosphohydrolase [Flavobacteriales bacterium]